MQGWPDAEAVTIKQTLFSHHKQSSGSALTGGYFQYFAVAAQCSPAAQEASREESQRLEVQALPGHVEATQHELQLRAEAELKSPSKPIRTTPTSPWASSPVERASSPVCEETTPTSPWASSPARHTAHTTAVNYQYWTAIINLSILEISIIIQYS